MLLHVCVHGSLFVYVCLTSSGQQAGHKFLVLLARPGVVACAAGVGPVRSSLTACLASKSTPSVASRQLTRWLTFLRRYVGSQVQLLWLLFEKKQVEQASDVTSLTRLHCPPP